MDDTDLQALFVRPAQLDDSRQLAAQILLRVDAHQRRRRILLWTAGLIGVAISCGLLAASIGWPLLVEALQATGHRLSGLMGHDVVALSPPEPVRKYGVWVMAVLGLLATGFAAKRALPDHAG